jgi:hypothetical protein
LKIATRTLDYTIFAAAAVITFVVAYFASRSTPIYVDEYTYTFLGHFLISGKLATLSSFNSLYKSMGYIGPTVQLPWGPGTTVEPWLDHPPIVSIILIPFLLADLPARTLPILFTSLVSGMLYVILRRKKLLAFITIAVWIVFVATNPILSMLFLETGVSFFVMLTLVLTSEYANGKKSEYYLYAAAVTVGLAAASKESGLSTVAYFGIFLLYMKLKEKKSIVSSLKPFLISVFLSAIWFVFAYLTAPKLFLDLLTINSHRYQEPGGPNLFKDIPRFFVVQPNLSNPTGMQFGPLSLLMLLGVAGVGYLIVRAFFSRDLLLEVLLVSCYLAFILPSEVFFYTTIVMFPFYSIGIAAILYDITMKAKGAMQQQVESLARTFPT